MPNRAYLRRTTHVEESVLISIEKELPVTPVSLDLSGSSAVGLVVIDPGIGFTRRGNLSDPARMVPMVRAIGEEYRRLRAALDARLHTVVFLDTHAADIPEPPYPPHGIVGTGEEDIDPELSWLLREERVCLIRKDCINGFIGAIDRTTGRNALTQWIVANRVRTLLVTGDCTDICVSDFVLTLLSARNHGLLTDVDPVIDREGYVAAITGFEIAVLPRACATFDAPLHNAEIAHHVGLWMMAGRGAKIASEWTCCAVKTT